MSISSPSTFSLDDNLTNAESALNNDYDDDDTEMIDTNITNSENINTVTSLNSAVPIQTVSILDGKYFKVVGFENNGKKITAVCQLCKPEGHTKIKGLPNSSSNFLSHLKRRHGQNVVAEYASYVQRKNIGKSVNNNKEKLNKGSLKAGRSFSKEKFDRDVTKFIIDSMVPLHVVENQYFRAMFLQFIPENIQFKILSRRILNKRICDMSGAIKTYLKNHFQSIPYFCTTTDVWSEKKRGFLGVTIHWIDENFHRQSAALACRRFSGTHSFDRIAFLLQNIYLEYGVQNDKILTTVTDNGSNFVKAFKMFGVSEDAMCLEHRDEELENSIDQDDDEEQVLSWERTLSAHIRCFSHTLHLCATTDASKAILQSVHAQVHQKTIERCNILWKAAAKPKSAEIIQQTLGHTLQKPGITRWNSLYDALKGILQEEEKYPTLAEELQLDPSSTLTIINFVYLKEYLQCSQPIAEAIDILQGEKYMYFGIAIPTLFSLQRKLTILSNKSWFYCESLINSYKNSVKRRFQEYFDLETMLSKNAAIAALSHPQFKTKWFPCISDDEKKNAIIQLFKSKVAAEIQIITTDDQLPNTSLQEVDQNFSFFDFGDEETNNNSTSITAAAEMEVLRFFQDTDLRFISLKKYSGVEQVFLKYNTALPSSAPVERLFSWATITNRPKANRLSDENFEMRVILKANSKYFEQI